MTDSQTLHPLRIVIVDDHPNTANMLARVLSKFEQPVEIITASSGEDAIRRIDQGVVDVLITDFMMPGMNGLQLIEQLRGNQKPAHIILITAYDTPGLVITARRLGVQDYLVKPVQPEKIRSIVAKVLEDLNHISPSMPAAVARRSFKILIADDYPDNLRLLSARLQSEGYNFISAWDGEEALRKVREEDVDLVLLDVNMPKKDGFQVLAELRADPAIAHIPVIMITAARIGPRDVRDGLALGADDYVIKPFDWRELAARIQSKLRVKQAEDILRRRTKELGILPELGQELSAQLDVDALSDIVLSRTVAWLKASLARLDIYQPNGLAVCRERAIGDHTTRLLDEVGREQAVNWGASAAVIASSQGVVIGDLSADSRWRSEHGQCGSAVAVPLLGRYKVIGVLTLVHEQPEYFTQEHQTILQAIASQAAIALENAQLFDVEHRRLEELMALNEISQHINHLTQSQQLIEHLPRLVQSRLNYPAVALWECPANGDGALQLVGAAGSAGSVEADALSEAPRQAAAARKPVLLCEGTPVISSAAVPIISDQRVRGALSVYSEHPNAFQESDCALLQAVATQALSALDRMALFESVEKEQRRLLAVLRSAADAILVMDAHNRLTLANPAGECLFPDLDEHGGKSLPQAGGYNDLLRLLEQAHTTGEHCQGEIGWPDGRTFSALVTPIEEGGQVVVLHDISQFIALAALKNEFIASATHDLKNPLMAVLGYNELMAKAGPLTDMQVEFSKRIQNSAMLMRDLVLNLLEISRLESGIQMKTEVLDLHALLKESVQTIREQALLRGQTLRVNFCPAQPHICGDRQLLQQLVSNLLGNAVKYTPPQQEICLSTSLEGDQVVISFEDQGIGIAPEDLPFIFNKFYRVRNEETIEIEGTGLGLAIVKSIVESHQGQIEVASQKGLGTTFRVHLPTIQSEG